MEKTNAKIFGIGLSKTGTSSLAQALQFLGFKTKDYMGIERYVCGDLSSIDMDTVLAHDALTDTPIPSFYRELDARFPGSKFILTVRDRDGWLNSCRKQFNERFAAAQIGAHKRLFEDLYGTDVFDEHLFETGYKKFVAGVLDYFKSRSADLLILDVAAGEGWEKLCPFLGRPVPDVPFPKANVTQIRWMRIEEVVSIAEEAGAQLLRRRTVNVDAASEVAPPSSSAAQDLFTRVLGSVLRRDPADSASRSAHKVLVTGLKKLRPGIPILSRVGEIAPYAERKQWNHFWLLDPLDGQEAFAQGSPNFSVNVALIEDGQPIYGVVHAPACHLTYFGRLGKGAFRKLGDAGGAPLPVLQDRRQTPALSMAANEPDETPAPSTYADSLALRMCADLERPLVDCHPYPAAPEWRTAAARAVLRAAGLSIRTRGGLAAPRYNTPDLCTLPMTVDAGSAHVTQAAP
jgi:3'-phosphoadenosine 5'-phosphosulfate (PAPS) 3'-phosphatase